MLLVTDFVLNIQHLAGKTKLEEKLKKKINKKFKIKKKIRQKARCKKKLKYFRKRDIKIYKSHTNSDKNCFIFLQRCKKMKEQKQQEKLNKTVDTRVESSQTTKRSSSDKIFLPNIYKYKYDLRRNTTMDYDSIQKPKTFNSEFFKSFNS